MIFFGYSLSVSILYTIDVFLYAFSLVMHLIVNFLLYNFVQHIGEKLFVHVKEEAKRLGCYEVTLNVWAGNTSAEKFYEKMGLKTKEQQMEYIL